MKQQHWSQIAEYSSLVGLTVALMTRQVAAAPCLALFIWLNLKNRRDLERATHAAIQNAVQPAYAQLATVSATLQTLESHTICRRLWGNHGHRLTMS
ncbi:hypothetical protein H6F89_33975 [Cyanobacteria bacterium FACHB-63]|nr:hypothetical protein [Cyanobacteria bacterium FACHB-63]